MTGARHCRPASPDVPRPQPPAPGAPRPRAPGPGATAQEGRPPAAGSSRRAVLRAGALAGAFGGAALVAPAAARAGLRAAGLRAAALQAATSAPAPGDGPLPGGTAAAAAPAASPTAAPAAPPPPPATYGFGQGWLFGGPYVTGSTAPGYDDSAFAQVTLPHTVTPLSWADWDNASWEKVWIYRKHFDATGLAGGRVFADFDGVMTNATAVLNGTTVATHQGGYLPWPAELTRQLRPGPNVLAVVVDARWLPVPPSGAPAGAASIDFLQPGGIYRDVTLRVVPPVFLADVFARPTDVLTSGRSVRVQATIDAAVAAGTVTVTAALLDGAAELSAASTSVTITGPGTSVVPLTLSGFGPVTLWSPDTPRLYQVQVTLTVPGAPPHTVTVRTGFREAVFRPGGFTLNGEPLKIFGLNRHQLFPYLGMAAPARLQRRDAEILRNDLNCNMVRCSHYPQSPHFLDACDELGLMVWQEPPGWHYVGDAAWQRIVLANMADMVVRDRNRPSVIVWGARLNETASQPALYRKTREIAYRLDGSRPTSGAMSSYSTAGWAEDVFGYDDYHHAHGNAVLKPPLPGVPYLVSEAVGALDGPPTYIWTDPPSSLAVQALMHGQVHSIAGLDPRYAGLLGWAGIDYASYNAGDRIWHALKTPGVLDTFRIAKPGAALYRSQVDPGVRPVIAPAFWWDFGPGSPPRGPGRGAMIATNCDRLEIYAGGQHLATGIPDTARFGGLRYPPVFADLTVDGSTRPDLRIDGYVSGVPAATLHMSADTTLDSLALAIDDPVIEADGSDATWLTFRAVDAYGNHRPGVTGAVTLTLAGPADLIGGNPFPLGSYGGVGGAFVRSRPGRTGRAVVTASHPTLGRAAVPVTIAPPAAGRSFR
jgi:beta-galactosidase